MKREDFKALTVGQRVVVNGKMDYRHFVNEVGTIIHDPNPIPGEILLIRFDHWYSGHGNEDREYYFRDDSVADFTIEPEHRSTYLNGHSDLKSEGTFITAWDCADGLWPSSNEPFSSLEEADKNADKLARENPGDTVAVLRVVRKHTSSVTVEAKTV